MKIHAKWINHTGTQALCAALRDKGYRALFVGGCVRNSLLNVPVSDIDIASDATPDTVSNIAENSGFKVIPTGIDHGTVTVVADGLAHEVTTFRRDVATDGRRATVAYSTNIAEDAARRDFTMNALYAEADGTVIDPLGGFEDLRTGRLRFVGDATLRIQEDYLRILRFFRFHAIYGDPMGGIDAEGLAACAANADGIATLSAERIGAEMKKLLASRDPAPSVASMALAGVLSHILPGADPRGLAPLVHLEAGLSPRWEARLAVIGGENPSDRLRLSRAETVSIKAIRDEIGSGNTPAALGWIHGGDIARDIVLNRSALLKMPLPHNWLQEIARGEIATMPVCAADLMPTLQGQALGKKLGEIEARWLASDLYLRKSELLA